MNWTSEQKNVINSRNGNLLVAAAAGSGKTAVLVENIIETVLGVDSSGNKISEGVDIDELLVVTFTNAAASQMKEKIADVLAKKAEEMPYDEHIVKQQALISRAKICTIDSFCLGIVKDYFNIVGIDSNFDIADNAEMELIKADVMNEVLEECYLENNTEFIRLINAFARKESDKQVSDLVENIYKVSSSFPRPMIWLDNAKRTLAMANETDLLDARWYKEYEKIVREVINSAILMATRCLDVCNMNRGPAGYRDAVCSDIDMFNSMYNQKKLESIKNCFTGFSKLGKNKKDSFDEELAVYVKSVRNKYKDLINSVVASIEPADKVIKEIKLVSKTIIPLIDLTIRYRTGLDRVKREKNVFEFHDIEEFALSIVCGEYDDSGRAIPSDVGEAISQNYRRIFIDEYQDSNFLQEDILSCVSGHGEKLHNTFMVGDVKQSIYRFRMARPDLFINKYDTYKDYEEGGDCSKIILSNNFRSSKSVIDFVNMIFAPLMAKDMGGIEYDDSAYLKPGEEQIKAAASDLVPEIVLVENNSKGLPDEYSNIEIEAISIANEIERIVNGDKIIYVNDDSVPNGKRKATYKDIVILLRSVKTSSSVFDSIFSERGIPLYLESEQGYFDAIEVNTLLSMLAVIDNAYIDYELTAVLRSPLVGINENELAYVVGVYNEYVRVNEDAKNLRNVMLYDKIKYYVNLNNEDELTGKLEKFIGMLTYLKEEKNYLSISDMIRYVLDETGYYWYVSAMGMGKRRQANIDMLISKADAYEDSSFKGLFNFLRYIDRLKVNDIDFAEAGTLSDNDNVVRVMTMHKSKGLEFPIVFVSGLGKKLTNMDAKSQVIIHPDYYLSSYAIDTTNRIRQNTFARSAVITLMKTEMLSEEMRILYVALTRAKQKLYVTAGVDSIDKTIEKCSHMMTINDKLLYVDKLSVSYFIEWILMSLDVCSNSTALVNIIKKNATEVILESIDLFSIDDDNCGAAAPVIDSKIIDEATKALSFSYSFGSANYKSKMSITEIKRLKSEGEANKAVLIDSISLEHDNNKISDIDIPVPEFMKKEHTIQGNEIGTVMHKIMELIDFNKVSMEDVSKQVDIMFEKNIFHDAFKSKIDISKLYKMINSNLGLRMAKADNEGKLYREQQFYISMNPKDIWGDESTTDEIIVVQGIIDAYFVEDGEVVLLDYKTDKVDNMQELVTKYRVQLDNYAKTIERLTPYKVKERIIWSFCLNDEISF